MLVITTRPRRCLPLMWTYNEDVGAHEEDESYEVEDIANYPRESSINWQGELDGSDDYNIIML